MSHQCGEGGSNSFKQGGTRAMLHQCAFHLPFHPRGADDSLAWPAWLAALPPACKGLQRSLLLLCCRRGFSMCARRPQLTHSNSTNGVDIAATQHTSNGSSPFAGMVARSCPKPILMPRRSRQGSLANHDELTVFVPPHELAASSLLDPTNVSRGHACGGTGTYACCKETAIVLQSVDIPRGTRLTLPPCSCCRLNTGVRQPVPQGQCRHSAALWCAAPHRLPGGAHRDTQAPDLSLQLQAVMGTLWWWW